MHQFDAIGFSKAVGLPACHLMASQRLRFHYLLCFISRYALLPVCYTQSVFNNV